MDRHESIKRALDFFLFSSSEKDEYGSREYTHTKAGWKWMGSVFLYILMGLSFFFRAWYSPLWNNQMSVGFRGNIHVVCPGDWFASSLMERWDKKKKVKTWHWNRKKNTKRENPKCWKRCFDHQRKKKMGMCVVFAWWPSALDFLAGCDPRLRLFLRHSLRLLATSETKARQHLIHVSSLKCNRKRRENQRGRYWSLRWRQIMAQPTSLSLFHPTIRDSGIIPASHHSSAIRMWFSSSFSYRMEIGGITKWPDGLRQSLPARVCRFCRFLRKIDRLYIARGSNCVFSSCE